MQPVVKEGRQTSLDQLLFLAMVAVLPLHTVFLSAWISWKPYLALLVVLAGADLWQGWRRRRWPWHPLVSLALLPFFGAVLVGFPVPEYRERFVRLALALAVGALVMLVTERRLRFQGLGDLTLRVIYWTAALIGSTAVLIELVAVGAFGPGPILAFDGVPGLYRVFKPAYLETGFLALTNWHQDPGYGAAWSVLWSVLALFAVYRGQGSGRWWVDGLVLGGLGFAVVMAFSRTGWAALPIALGIATWALVRRWGVRPGSVLKRLAFGLLTTLVLIAAVWSVDVENVGGDLDLQFAFRFSQGFDLLASITGLFAGSEAFEDRFDVSEERADVWPEYVEFFRSHPLTGVGLGVGWESTSITQEPHNLALELLGETGLLGLAGFLFLLWTIIRTGSGVIGGVALITAFLPSMTQTVLFEPAWWFAAGLYLGSSPRRSRGEGDPTAEPWGRGEAERSEPG